MKMKLRQPMFLVVALAAAPAARAQGERVLLECKGGEYVEDGSRRVAGGDFHCQRHPGLNAVAVSLSAPHLGRPSRNADPNNPPCSGIRCVTFVVNSPVPVGELQVIEPQAHEGKGEKDQSCFSTKVIGGSNNYRAERQVGRCRIDWSGWDDLTVNNSNGTVSATFKNWSHDRNRWGVLWLWYKPR